MASVRVRIRPPGAFGGEKAMFQAAIDGRLRQEQTDLNYLFIELLSRVHREQPEEGSDAVLGLRREWVANIARMRHRKRHDIAECSFALYGLRLQDSRFWSAVRPRRRSAFRMAVPREGSERPKARSSRERQRRETAMWSVPVSMILEKCWTMAAEKRSFASAGGVTLKSNAR